MICIYDTLLNQFLSFSWGCRRNIFLCFFYVEYEYLMGEMCSQLLILPISFLCDDEEKTAERKNTFMNRHLPVDKDKKTTRIDYSRNWMQRNFYMSHSEKEPLMNCFVFSEKKKKMQIQVQTAWKRQLFPMRTSLKCCVFYLIIGVILLNLYFLGHVYIQQPGADETKPSDESDNIFPKIAQSNHHHHHQVNSIVTTIPKSEFIILDYTGHQHIFRENDPIKCKKYLHRYLRILLFSSLWNHFSIWMRRWSRNRNVTDKCFFLSVIKIRLD